MKATIIFGMLLLAAAEVKPKSKLTRDLESLQTSLEHKKTHTVPAKKAKKLNIIAQGDQRRVEAEQLQRNLNQKAALEAEQHERKLNQKKMTQGYAQVLNMQNRADAQFELETDEAGRVRRAEHEIKNADEDVMLANEKRGQALAEEFKANKQAHQAEGEIEYHHEKESGLEAKQAELKYTSRPDVLAKSKVEQELKIEKLQAELAEQEARNFRNKAEIAREKAKLAASDAVQARILKKKASKIIDFKEQPKARKLMKTAETSQSSTTFATVNREPTPEDKGNYMCHKGHILPNVFLLGAQKAGSTSLWNDIQKHFPIQSAKAMSKCTAIDSDIAEHVEACEGLSREMCPLKELTKLWGPICETKGEPAFMSKEVHFFDSEEAWSKGGDNYLKHYPMCKDEESNVRTMDATPAYLSHPSVHSNEDTAPERMTQMYGDRVDDLHFVVLLRDPSKRMESGYWHFMPNHEGDFDTYVSKTAPHAQAWAESFVGSVDGADVPLALQPQNPYANSMYARDLKKWLRWFEPHQFSVVSLQQYIDDPQAVLDFVSQRTGISAHSRIDRATHANMRVHAPMNSKTQAALATIFEQPTKALQNLCVTHDFCMASRNGDAMNSEESNNEGKSNVPMTMWDMSEPGEELSFRQKATSDGVVA